MKNLTSCALTVACVFAIAGCLFLAQRRNLQHLRAERAAEHARVAVVPEADTPPRPPAASVPAPVSPPATAAPDGSVLVEKIFGALEQKRTELEEAGDKAYSAVWAERLGILLELSPEQSESARSFFHQLMVEARAMSVRPDAGGPAGPAEFAALEHRLAEYLSSQFGEEKAARFRSAERARVEAAVEHDAGEALDAVSEVVDLPPDQKDTLYGAFAEKARERISTFAPGHLKSQLTYAFQEGPRVEDPLSLARTVLTPEQIALYEQNRASEAREQQRAMQTALHVMRDVFQQTIGP